MKMIILKLLLLVSGFSIVQTNKTILPQKQSAFDKDFEKRISFIHSSIIDLTDIFVLHHIKQFNEVYNNPEKFQNQASKYLQKPFSFENKVIAIYSVTKLPLGKYLDFLQTCFDLYKKKRITESLLDKATFNEFDTHNMLVLNYKNIRFRSILKKMRQEKTLSKEFKISIEDVLSGKRLRNLQAYKIL